MPNQKIENVISTLLTDDARKNALDFIAHLRAEGIPIEESENYWEISYRDESVCFLWINGSNEMPGPWTIWSAQVPGAWAFWEDGEAGGSYGDFPIEDEMRKIAWANINVCGNCGGCGKNGGRRKTVLGKEFDNLCKSALAFTNPDVKALYCAKKMIDIRKNEILKKQEAGEQQSLP